MFRYLMVESTTSIAQYKDTLIAFFSDMIHIQNIEITDNYLMFYFTGETHISFRDIIVNLSSDTLSDIRLFESHHFRTERERDKNKESIIAMLAKIEMAKHAYLNEHIILSMFMHHLTLELKACFLKGYAHDQVMLNSVRVYLESNQNTSYAAKQLFIHRNTLIQRIDKFIDVTGFDIREFVPGYLIYNLLLFS